MFPVEASVSAKEYRTSEEKSVHYQPLDKNRLRHTCDRPWDNVRRLCQQTMMSARTKKRKIHQRTEVSSVDTPVGEVSEGSLASCTPLYVVCLWIGLDGEPMGGLFITFGPMHDLRSLDCTKCSQSKCEGPQKMMECHDDLDECQSKEREWEKEAGHSQAEADLPRGSDLKYCQLKVLQDQ